MGSSVKRRPAERKRSSRNSSSKGSSGEISRREWVNEALAIIFGAASLFLLISFVTADLSRFSLDTTVRSLSPMGPVGRVTGEFLARWLGWGALVVVVWTGWLSRYFWFRDDSLPLLEIRSKYLLPLGLLGMLAFSCGLLSALGRPETGGLMGSTVGSPLVRAFGAPGALLIFSALALASIALATRQSIGTIVRGSVLQGWAALKFAAITIPLFIWSCLVRVVEGALSVLSYLAEGFFGGEEKDERRIPSPRVRKNLLKSAEESEESSDEEEKEISPEDDESDPYADAPPAVVERKSAASRLPDKELRKVRKKVVEQMKETPEFGEYIPPDLSLLERGETTPGAEDDDELREKSKQIENKLRDFGILGKVTHIHPGPVITLFEFEPAPGVKVGKIASLQDDLAMSLKASSIRIIAPIPKRGTVGIEVPNRHREIVRLRDILESDAFMKAEATLTVPMGKDTYGEPVAVDIAQMPHLLIAGTTGTGKSVCINSLLVSLLYKASPAELGLILIDPKILELSVYDDIPHLRVPVVTVPRQAKAVLEWAVNEMNRRYRMMQKFGVRNIDSYNKFIAGEEDKPATPAAENAPSLAAQVEVMAEEPLDVPLEDPAADEEPLESIAPEKLKPLSKIVIVIDELADLMLTVGRDIEELITRLAQKARAAGIHLIVATQRPSVDVVTGLIKANFPARISFRVATRVDSRTILDQMGADKLLGRGDMLFMIPGHDGGLRRVHGAFVADSEVKKIVDQIKSRCKPCYDERIMALCEKAMEEDRPEGQSGTPSPDDYDDMYDKCVEFVVEKGHASTSMLQRAFRLGYNRAARIVDMMEREGIVGPADGAKPREVLVQTEQQHQEGIG